MLQYRADVDRQDETTKRTALHEARCMDPEPARDCRETVRVVDSAQALDQGHASAAWALISAKADKSLKDNKGHTALMLGNLVSPVLSWIAIGLTQAAVGLLRACRSQDGCGNARVPRAKLSLGGRCLRMLWQRQELGPQNAQL